MLTYRVATEADARDLAPRLRESDRTEITLSSGPDNEKTLVESVRLSVEAHCAVEDGKVICLWGIGEQDCDGVPWMVASPEAMKHPKKLVKRTRQIIKRWSRHYRLLYNMVHAENITTIRWLKSVGFTIGPLEPAYGVGKAPFHLFFIRKPYV